MSEESIETQKRQNTLSIPGKQRFMNVDIIDFLGKIAEAVIIHNQGDWFIDIQTLHKLAASQMPDDKKLMWSISSVGTHLFTERDTFIKGIAGNSYWTTYEPDIPVKLGFMVEITNFDGKVIKGNVFDVGNYAEHVDFVRHAAIPVEGITVTFENGAVHTMNMDMYDLNRGRLADESGKVVDTRFYSANDDALNMLLLREELLRGSFPFCNPNVYLGSLTEMLADPRYPGTDNVYARRSGKAIKQGKKTPAITSKKDKTPIGDKLRAAQEKVNAQTINKTSSRQRDNRGID